MKRGVLRAFNAGAYTATVEIDGSIASHLSGVPVARNVASAELIAGRSVAVYFFDLANPGNAVLMAVWT